MIFLLKCLQCCTGFLWDPSRSGFKGWRYWVRNTNASEFWRTGLRIFLQKGISFNKFSIPSCYNWCHSNQHAFVVIVQVHFFESVLKTFFFSLFLSNQGLQILSWLELFGFCIRFKRSRNRLRNFLINRKSSR